MNGFGSGGHARRALQLAIMVVALAVLAVEGLPAFGATTLTAPVLSSPVTTSTTVKLTWTDPNTQESGYVVERGPAATGPFAQIADLNNNNTTYTDTGLSPGTTLYYRVYARGKRGVTSATSNVMSAHTQGGVDTIAPSVPTTVSATATSCNNVNVSWSSVTDTGGSGLRGYYVWRDGSLVTPLGSPVSGTSLSDNTVSPNRSYSYQVSAVDNADNQSAKSTAVANATTPTYPTCPDTIAPGVPGGVAATATSCTNVTVSWSSVTDTGGSGLRGYYVYRDGARVTQGAPVSASPFADSTVGANHSYSYTVSAVDNAGNESTQSAASATSTPAYPTCPDTTAPGVPGGMAATPTSCNSVNVSWSSVTDTGGAGLRGYYVYRDGSLVTQTPVSASPFNDTTVAASHSYSYQVSAVDNAGNLSAKSVAVNGSTGPCADTIAPGVPVGVTATATSCTNANASWSSVTDTGGSGLRGYYVYRDGARLTQSVVTATSFADTTLSAGRSYSYAVSAIDNAGNESAKSATASATTSWPTCPDTIAPPVPGGVTATTTSCSNVNVNWSLVNDTGGSNLRGYYVYRNGQRLTPQSVPLLSLSYSDGTVAPNTTYSYTVSAVDGAGNESSQSTAAQTTTNWPTCPDTIAPTVPGGVSATATCTSASVSWSATTDTGGSGLRGYYVYRNGTRLTPQGAPLATTSFNDATVAGNTSYAYKVSAVDNAGNESAQSAAASAQTGCVTGTPGAFVSGQRFGGTGIDAGYAIAGASDGSSAIAGEFAGSASFGGAAVTSHGASDIVVAKYRPDGSNVWTKALGGAGYDRGWSVALASNGDVIVSGSFTATVDFGGGPQSAVGNDVAGFVARYDAASGAYEWSHTFRGEQPLGTYAYGVAVAPTGDVVVTGQYSGTVDFGGPTPVTSSSGSADVFVVRYVGATGAYASLKTWGGAGSETATSVAVDSANNVIIGGIYNTGPAEDVGNGVTVTNEGQFDDAFLVKYDSSFNALWAKSIGGDFHDATYGVAADRNGNVIATGQFSDTANFDGQRVAAAGVKSDIFVEKFTPTGSRLWLNTYGNSGTDDAMGIAVDSTGAVVIGGYFQNTVNFGGGNRVAAGSMDGYVLKLDANGGYKWDKAFGSPSEGWGVPAIGSQDHVLVSGAFAGTATFDGHVVTSSAGSRDALLVQLLP